MGSLVCSEVANYGLSGRTGAATMTSSSDPLIHKICT
jgi:hypothetical protein